MIKSYFSVINTGTWKGMMHDATRPYAVVEVSRADGRITHTASRHVSYRGACVKVAKLNKESK